MNSQQTKPRVNASHAFPTLWVVGTLRLLATAAFAFAVFLAWSAFQAGDIAGCSGGGVWDCSHVLHSKWAKWMSIPVSIPAAALYASMLVSLLFVGEGVPKSVRRTAWSLVTTMAFAAALSAIWFIYLQVFVLEHLCKYCLVVHGCGLVIAALAILKRPFAWSATAKMGAVAAAAASVLILGQVYGKAPQTFAVEVHDSHDHDSQPSASDVATLDAPADDEFGSPLDEFAADEFAAPVEDSEDLVASEEDVFAAPVEVDDGNTRPVSTAAPQESPAATDSTMIDSSPNPVSPFATAPNPIVPARIPPPSLAPPLPSLGPPLPPATSEPPVAKGLVIEDPQVQPIGHEEPVKTRPVATQKKRLVRYPGADVNLNVANWPILGSDQAPHVVVELFDYTCPYCRTMHKHITVARERFGDQVAFIVMPVPLSRECNPTVRNTSPDHADACEIARLALGVWRCDANAFPPYHEWLMAGDHARTAAEARQHAETLVDAAKLRETLAKPLLSQFISRHVALYKRSGEGTLPKLLTERVTVRGKMDSADTLCRTLKDNLGIDAN